MRRLFFVLWLALITLAVFWEIPNQPFLGYDDDVHVYANPFYENPNGLNLTYFWRAPFHRITAQEQLLASQVWSPPYQHIYTPLSFSFLGVLSQIYPLSSPTETPSGTLSTFNPAVFHTAGVLLHLANTLLVFALLTLIFKNDWGAFAGALLFSIHPVQVETVAWITQTNKLLSTLFALLCLICYRQYLYNSVSSSKKISMRNSAYYAVATLCYVLAMLAMPSAVVIAPIVLVLAWLLKTNRNPLTVLLPLIPWGIFAFFILLINRGLQDTPQAEIITTWWQRPFIVGEALRLYLLKIIWPIDTALDYGWTPAHLLRQWTVYFSWLGISAIGAICFHLRSRLPWLWMGVTIFGIAVLPMTGIVPYYHHAYSIVADRYLYLALLGMSLMLAGAWNALGQNSKAGGKPRIVFAACFLLIALLMGFRSSMQTLMFYEPLALWQNTLEVNPRSALAHEQLGILTSHQGRMNESISHYQQATKLNPRNERAHNNLAIVLTHAGRLDEALEYFRRAAEIAPGHPQIRGNLGIALVKQQRYKEAIPHLQYALKIQPQNERWRAALQRVSNM